MKRFIRHSLNALVAGLMLQGAAQAREIGTEVIAIGAADVVHAGSQVVLSASREIRLGPGFKAEAGSRFRAVVAGAASDGAESLSALLPAAFALLQNAPNPFNPETAIAYALSEEGAVELAIYNAVGQQLRTLVRAQQAAGHYRVLWDGRDEAGRAAASGMYFYRLISGTQVQTRQMTLLR